MTAAVNPTGATGAASAAALLPIERRTLNEIAYARLKKALLSGRFEPGRVLTLRGLAAALGTSVMPVRDAVGRLATEQAFEVLPNRGIRIPRLAPEQADEVWRLRVLLEGEAAGLAALRATEAEIREIARLRDEVRAAAGGGDLHATLDANDSFQFAVYRAAKTHVLLRLIEVLRMRCLPHCTAALRRLLVERPPFLAETLGYHDTLVAALAARDERGAVTAKRRDLERLREWVNATERSSGVPAGSPPRVRRAAPSRRSSRRRTPTRESR
jgi:DNA-binding GntR family transcriptional regulator